MRRVFVIVPVAVFAILMSVLAYLTVQTQQGRDPSLIPSPLIGKPVPDFALPAVADTVPGGFASADLRGRVTLINVFASWCIPCLAEHPQISRLAADGVPVYGIDHRDTAADVLAWLERNGNPYTVVGFDGDGRASLEWGVTGVPETYIVNAAGIVTYKYTGPITADVLEGKILPKLREAGQ